MTAEKGETVDYTDIKPDVEYEIEYEVKMEYVDETKVEVDLDE